MRDGRGFILNLLLILWKLSSLLANSNGCSNCRVLVNVLWNHHDIRQYEASRGARAWNVTVNAIVGSMLTRGNKIFNISIEFCRSTSHSCGISLGNGERSVLTLDFFCPRCCERENTKRHKKKFSSQFIVTHSKV